MAKRLVRAKRKIRDAGIPYSVPESDTWGARLGSVLAVVYLIFNQGYSASGADPRERTALCQEAIRLARVLAMLLPREPEVLGRGGRRHHRRPAHRREYPAAAAPPAEAKGCGQEQAEETIAQRRASRSRPGRCQRRAEHRVGGCRGRR